MPKALFLFGFWTTVVGSVFEALMIPFIIWINRGVTVALIPIVLAMTMCAVGVKRLDPTNQMGLPFLTNGPFPWTICGFGLLAGLVALAIAH